MTRKILKILFLILVILSVFGVSKSYAKWLDIGEGKGTVKLNSPYRGNYLYCMKKGAHVNYLCTAVEVDDNGNLIGTDIRSQIASKGETDLIAYILNRSGWGNGHDSDKQQELWAHSSLFGSSINHNNCAKKAEIDSYIAYKNILNNGYQSKFTTYNQKVETNGNNKIIGPFAVEFLETTIGGTTYAGFQSIQVFNDSGSSISYTLLNENKQSINTITSNQVFYVQIPSSQTCSRINIQTYTKEIQLTSAYKADLKKVDDCGNRTHSNATQPIFWGSTNVSTRTRSLNATISEETEKQVKYTLNINKKASDTNATLSGARFTIQASNALATNFSTISSSNISGNSSVTFTFTNTGTFTYVISETTVPSGYQGSSSVTLTIQVVLNARTGEYEVSSVNINPISTTTLSGNTLTVTNIPEEEPEPPASGNHTITIYKTNASTGGTLAGAYFTVTGSGINKTVGPTSSNGTASFNIEINSEGTFTYTITERTAPSGYIKSNESRTVTIVTRLNTTANRYEVVSCTACDNRSTTTFPNKPIYTSTYNYNLKKVDSETNEGLAGAEFSIVGPNVNKTVGPSDANGNIEITDIPINQAGTFEYTITETKGVYSYHQNSTPFKLTLRVSLVEYSTYARYEVQSATITEGSGVTQSGNTAIVPNVPVRVDISGLVWLDEIHIADKEGIYNGRIDSDEAQRFSGIEVNLYEGNTLVQTTRTNSNGEYTFSNVRGYRNYRVTFTYEGMTYTSTIFDSNTTNGEKTSKADETENVRREFNSKFREIIPGKATGSKGEINLNYNITPGSDTRYAVAEVDTNNPEFMIQVATPNFQIYGDDIINVNLGLVTRDKADFSMQQGVKEMTVTINGVTTKITEGITDINTEDEIREYLVQRNQTREYNIKNSDYTYRIGDYTDLSGSNKKVGANQTEELEIYITYMVAIKNGGDVDGVVNEVKNYYQDTYTITQINDKADGTGNNLAYQDGGSSNGYKIANIDTSILGTIEQGRSKWIYITYRINKNNQTERNIELGNKTTVIEIERYTTYRDNSSADYEKYSNGVLDANSAPGNLNITADVSTHENDTAKAPTLNITKGEKRTITGNVWDDLNQDGYKNDGTVPINGITVQLVEIYKGREFIWKEMYTGEQNISYVDYIGSINRDQTNVKSIEDGEYYFEDFIPGEYIIRFRYGDTVKTVKLQSDGGANEKSYNGHAYESTIYGYDSKAQDRSDRRNEVLNNTKTVNNKIGSLLVAPYEDPSDEKITELIELTWMASDTDPIRVDSETENIDNIQLGLKERKKDNITVEKGISHINVTLNNGTEYANTNYPLEGGVSGIFDTPNGPWIQMSSEIINGATLKIKYKIKVTNNSDDNTITNLKFIDYLPEGMRIDYGTNTEWEGVDTSKLSNILDQSIVSSAQSSNKVMITNKNGITLNPNESKELEIEASVTLSPDMREYNYINLAEIIEYTSEAGRRNEEGVPGNQDPTPDETGEIETPEKDADTSEEVTITQNTGENKAPMYYFIGIGIAIVLLGGIGLIKKYVV